MGQGERSPKIVEVSWGRMEVAGLGVGKDYKAVPRWWARVGLVRDRYQARPGSRPGKR